MPVTAGSQRYIDENNEMQSKIEEIEKQAAEDILKIKNETQKQDHADNKEDEGHASTKRKQQSEE